MSDVSQPRQYRYDPEQSARDARHITDLRTPREPFGIAAGTIRTGHNVGDMPHPAWCSPDECTAGDPNFPHHLSAWQVTYPGHGGEAAIFVRLFSDAGEPVEERPCVELLLMRPGQCSSIEGYELRGEQARTLAAAIRRHAEVVGDEQHWTRQVES